MVHDALGNPVTDARWKAVELAISQFIRTYPLHWNKFKRDLHENRRTHNVATEGDLAQSGFRNTASFPVVYRRMTPIEKLTSPDQDDDLVEVANLYTILTELLPGLVEKDHGKGGAGTNRLFREFLRRFPAFLPSDKL